MHSLTSKALAGLGATLPDRRGGAGATIGILTFHRCINYGSYWQARCLAEGLRALGTNAVILDHRCARVNRAEWRCALQPLLPAKTTAADQSMYRKKIRKFFEAFEKLPLSRPFPLDGAPDMAEPDVILVGSDEVWNLKHPWYGGCPLFFGEGLADRRVASYAASFGNLASSEGLKGYWADKLRLFSDVSVRDLNSRGLVQDVLGIEPEIVLDPCLLFPATIRLGGEQGECGAYATVYGHSFPEWFQQAIRAWARRRGIILLSVGYRNAWADAHWLDAGPDDFAHVIAGSQAVVTNFFHGCVFSLVNEKPFACVLSDYRSKKIGDLTVTVGADHHVVARTTPAARLDALLDEPLDPAISKRIEAMRHQSRMYLDHVLH